jgi:hypothetical protein
MTAQTDCEHHRRSSFVVHDIHICTVIQEKSDQIDITGFDRELN